MKSDPGSPRPLPALAKSVSGASCRFPGCRMLAVAVPIVDEFITMTVDVLKIHGLVPIARRQPRLICHGIRCQFYVGCFVPCFPSTKCSIPTRGAGVANP